MKKQTSIPIKFEDAAKILDNCYMADTSSYYIGRFRVHGSNIDAQIEALPNHTNLQSYQRFVVKAQSGTFSEATLNELLQ